jgi:aryl-alcohol dehydrogenase-like predicted oxidoreductase
MSLHFVGSSAPSTKLPKSISLQRIRTLEEPLTIGRLNSCHITLEPCKKLFLQNQWKLNYKLVLSRRHALISYKNEQYMITVLGRTWIDGVEQPKLSTRPLFDGQVISFGPPVIGVKYQVTLKRKQIKKEEQQQEQLEEQINRRRHNQHVVALGTLALSVLYPTQRPSRIDALQLLRDAILIHGVRFIDVADTYCGNGNDLHYSERLVSECMSSLPDQVKEKVVVATKGGMERYGDGTISSKTWRPAKMTPEYVRKCIMNSKEALGVERIELWQLHHTDQYSADSDEFLKIITAANQAINDGHVEKIGLCNCSTEHIIVAHKLLSDRLWTISNSYSLYDRATEKISPREMGKVCSKSNKHGVVKLCEKLGLTFLAYACVGGIQTRDGRRDLLSSFPMLEEIAKDTSSSVENVNGSGGSGGSGGSTTRWCAKC